jgi:ketosteroid isomerase-like protein
MAPPTVEEIAKRFCDVSNGHADDPEFAALFADTVAVWHNFDEQPMPLPGAVLASALQQEVTAMKKGMKDYRHDDVRLRVVDDSFVLTRTTRGTLPDGSQLGLSQCLINFVADGKIVRSEAYLDREQAAPIYAYLGSLVESGEFTPPDFSAAADH